MEIIRILPLRQFDPYKGRFSNLVFKQPSGTGLGPDGKKGISVFDRECAEQLGRSPCEHIAHFYAAEFRQPCAYWSFSSALLDPPVGSTNIPTPEFVKEPSSTGDPCHCNIHFLGSERSKKLFDNRFSEGLLMLCVDGIGRAFEADVATMLKRQHFPDPS